MFSRSVFSRSGFSRSVFSSSGFSRSEVCGLSSLSFLGLCFLDTRSYTPMFRIPDMIDEFRVICFIFKDGVEF